MYQCDSCKRDFVHFGRYQLHMNMVHKTEVHKDQDSVLQHQQEAGITVVAISQDLETNVSKFMIMHNFILINVIR